MTTTRRTQLSRIMAEAWGWFRSVGGTFADALRMAWKAHRMRAAGPILLHRVKPSRRPVASPLTATAYLSTRYNANRAAWYGAKFAGGGC